nr:DUF4398 domain-containing protein [Pseudomonas sp. BIGb0427]
MPVPSEQVSLARNALNRAVSAGATQYAPLQMKTAQDKSALMDQALGEKKLRPGQGACRADPGRLGPGRAHGPYREIAERTESGAKRYSSPQARNAAGT